MSGPTSGKIAKRCLSLETVRSMPTPQVIVQQPKKMESPYKHAACYSKCSDIHIASGKGCYVTDVNGKQYLDVTSGIAVLSTGHCHPKIVEAVQRQAATLMHGQLNCYRTHSALEELLAKLGPRMNHADLNTFVVDTTGTQANEAAVKLARRYTGKPNIICVHGGFHGRSALTSAMTSSNAGPRYPVATPLPSGVYFASAPMAFRWGCSEEEAIDRAVAQFEDIFLSQLPIDQVAAFMCEPVLGEGGFLQLPEEYLRRVSKICRDHGILTIADEVQAGVGRSGKMWASDHYAEDAWRPDILVAAKGIASGMPLSLFASSEEIMSVYTPGTHGGTYMGNAVACAAAAATLDVIEEEGLIENSRKQGALLKSMISRTRDQFFPDSDVRGSGLMIGVECKWNGKQSPEMARFIRTHCLDNGVLLYAPSGWDGCTLRVMPPLIIQEDEIVHIATALEAAAVAWNQKQNTPARSA